MRIMTPPQQQEFPALFENYVVATHGDRLTEYPRTLRVALLLLGTASAISYFLDR